ncbi:MAG: hypothetical protein AAGK93_00535 [Pseudomonadota bacterium]
MRLLWSLLVTSIAWFLIFLSMRAAARNAMAAYRNRDSEHLFEYWTMAAAMNLAWSIYVAASYVAIMVTSDGAFE